MITDQQTDIRVYRAVFVDKIENNANSAKSKELIVRGVVKSDSENMCIKTDDLEVNNGTRRRKLLRTAVPSVVRQTENGQGEDDIRR